MPKESDIRDKLSETLEILEPGLALVEVNHKLPNDAGAKGFIDILAKDKLGNLVIIELKRSDQASRQALFEILKYMQLFRQHHGIPAHRIRCFIVSTTWHELLVPFSEFRRLCETQTEGFRIEVDAAGNVLIAERITDHIEEVAARPFRMHAIYLYETPEERDKALPLIREAYTKAGAEGYLLLKLEYRGNSQRVIYPFAGYFVPTRIEGGLLDKLTKNAVAELEEAEGERPEPEAVRDNVQDNFLAIVQESLASHFLSTNLESSIGNPEAFTVMVEGGWTVISIDRIGPYASRLVMPDPEVVELVKGQSGDNNVQYGRLSSPRHKLDWAQVRSGAVNSLRGNPIWEAGFEWFLGHVEKEFPDGTALLQVYNPLMLPESLYRFAVQGTPEYLPQLALAVISADGSRLEGLVGTVVWDGKTVPKSFEEVFCEEFCDGIEIYYILKTAGSAWELDRELMRRHGLKYSLWWLTFGEEKVEHVKRMVLTAEGKIQESSDAEEPDSLADYCDAARPYLEQLFMAINHHVVWF